MKKELTREQAEAAKEKAARFVEDDEHADDLRSEDLDEWARRKRVTIIPPTRKH